MMTPFVNRASRYLNVWFAPNPLPTNPTMLDPWLDNRVLDL